MNSASVPVPEQLLSLSKYVEGARGGSTTAAELAEAHQPTNRRIVDIISDVNRRQAESSAELARVLPRREGGNAKRNMAYSAAA